MPRALLFLLTLTLGLAAVRSARAQESAPPALGPADAILEIVEFSDFECPYCGGARPVLDSLRARHGDAVRLVYRHFPLPMHGHAGPAAQAAVEAARQGAFWPYHDLLFTHQDRLTDADLAGYADSLGLDRAAFAAALAGGTHAAAVEADVALGQRLGVGGTPTFFLNGYRVVGTPPLWVFEQAIRAFRDGAAQPRALTP